MQRKNRRKIMDKVTSSLILDKLVFEKIEFYRKGLKNNKDINYQMDVQIGVDKDEMYKVTLILKGDKEGEYEFEIGLSGFFSFDSDGEINDNQKQELISKNTIAIMMPYLRSEVSLLTAQPETECVVLPPFNINRMLEQ